MPRRRARPPFAKRRSSIHGFGVFATRRIRGRHLLIDYEGRVLTSAQVDARYDEEDADDPHTLLFDIGDGKCIDASLGGNDARFINHSCDPNCEAELSGGVISIRTIRNIQPGAELTYDYALQIEKGASRARRSLYDCRCSAGDCRGTMLDADLFRDLGRRKQKKRRRPEGRRR